MSDSQWQSRPVDGKYLLDSGLLFEINHQVLHLVGLTLTVNKEGQIGLKDFRNTPEVLFFTREVLVNAQAKLRKFMDEFGNKQIDRREAKLGWGCQPKVY